METSSSRCCVALRAAGELYCEDVEAERSHKEMLLPMINRLCQQAQIEVRQLEAIACGAGPGSFTGVRIGVAAVQALALVAQCPVLMVNSLDVLATAAQRSVPQANWQNAVVLCARRSRGQAYYVAGYTFAQSTASAELERSPMALCTNLQEFRAWTESLADEFAGEQRFCGERPPWLAGAQCADLSATAVVPSAHNTMQVALLGLAAGSYVAPAAALPIYLPEDSPWQRQQSDS
ncbi:MAG: tRNA (adenosine(37)-N6)-threonylcarbamoyltransferase complex dimerization subunit type 1 TsaB [Pseudomonadales bacterium]